MKERPILFSAPMVRAILAGTKTQTRRAIKPQPSAMLEWTKSPRVWLDASSPADFASAMLRHCPYGKPGDRLWVRETIKQRPMTNFLTGKTIEGHIVAAYAADDEDVVEEAGFNVGPWWKNAASLPSIHMPRWASRITLEVTAVRVQRLQDISDEDAMAEGIETAGFWREDHPSSICFSVLWDKVNGDGAWNSNPWVWAITFRRLLGDRDEERVTTRDDEFHLAQVPA